MGISAGGGGSQRSDINVTPLVDVVLVLLIIFLVTMPVLMRHITLEIPRKLEDNEVPVESTSNTITVLGKADGTVVINDGSGEQTVNRVELASKIAPLLKEKKTEKVIFVDFEDEIVYSDAVGIMDTLKGAGAEKIALKTRDKKPTGFR
jgi:biopolymer transport protein ExbD